jgi:hypothetical protein
MQLMANPAECGSLFFDSHGRDEIVIVLRSKYVKSSQNDSKRNSGAALKNQLK